MRFFQKHAAVILWVLLIVISAASMPACAGAEGFWDYEEFWEGEAAPSPQEQAEAETPAGEAAASAEEKTAASAEEEAALPADGEDAKSIDEAAAGPARIETLKEGLFFQAPKQITISFTGDCTLGNTPLTRERHHDKSFEGYIEQYGKTYPFDKVKEYFLNDDLTVVNLEGVFYNYEANRAKKTYNFRAPTDYVEILTLAGVDAVSIGNNHILDYGEKGQKSTIETLEKAGVGWFGTNEAADGVYVFEKDGIRIGFISVYYSYWAKGGKNTDRIKKNISDLRQQGCNLIIACMHCGVEYDQMHDSNQEKMAAWMLRNGAEMVIGHHPHTIQGIRVENSRTTFWSLGNFVFGGNPGLNYKNPARNRVLNIESFIAQVTFSFDENNTYLGHQTNLIPCYMSGTAEYNNYQPVPVTGAQAEKVLDAIQVDSRPLRLKPFVEDVGAVQDFVPAPSK